MKKFIKNHKAITAVVLCVVLFFAIFLAVSHGVYHRSFLATVIEVYMNIIDRECIYTVGKDYEKTIEERTTGNLERYLKPDSVKMDIPYYDTYEHGMQVYHFNAESQSDTMIIYYPGGGYINAPLKYHWKIINKLVVATDCRVLMPVYLKVPNYTCEESYEVLLKFYMDVIKDESIKKVIFMGDSSGGGMSLVMAQILRDDYPEVIQPSDIVLLSPWLDVSMENEDIPEVDKVDPMLDTSGAKDLGLRWAGDKDVHDPMVSPIYGTFENLGRITMFASTRDVLCPDDVKLSEMLTQQGIDHTFVIEEGLNHPYVLFPIPEAKEAVATIINVINGN